MSPVQDSAGPAPRDEPPRVIRVEPSPGILVLMILIIPGLWLLNRLLPVVLVVVAALVIVGTISTAVRWIEERHVRRAEGMPAEQAAAIAVEISADRQKEENSPPAKTDAPADEGRES